MSSEVKCVFFLVFASYALANFRIKLYNHKSSNVFGTIGDTSDFFQSFSKEETLNLNSNEKGLYCGIVSLGTPPQQFEVVIATGLPYFWIPSKRCSWFNLACRVHKIYDSTKSTTYQDYGEEFSLSDGKLSGFISEDTLTIANININNQTFGESIKLGFSSFYNKFDGYLGLAFPLVSDTGIPPITSMVANGLLEKNLFSMALDRQESGEAGGELIFGGWNENRFNSSSVDFIPLSDNSAWIFDMDHITTLDGEEMCSNCQALADTGTALIIGHAEVVEKIYKKIGVITHWNEPTVNCLQVEKLPPITFQIHNRSYTLEGRDYVIKKKYFFFFTKCEVGIIGSQESFKPWILGNIFLKSFYSIYDFGNKQIAFASLK